MTHPMAVIVICDGNRPDFITDETTPAMAALRRAGQWHDNHRGIFPSATRASSASIATGSFPLAHGLRGNAVALPIPGGFEYHDAGKPEFFDTYRSHFGRMLTRPSLAERVSGLGAAVIASNVSPGAAFFHDSYSHAHMLHRHQSYGPGRTPATALPAKPGHDGDRVVTEAFIEALLERRPPVATLWLSEPDVSMHAAPLGSDLHLRALAQADELVARVVEAVGRLRDAGHDVLMLLGSDHGHESVTEVVAVEKRLFEAGFKTELDSPELVVVPQGSSAFLHLAGRALDRKDEITDWLRTRAWVEDVIQGADLPKLGQIPGDDVIAIDMAKESGSNVNGVPGLSAMATRFSEDPDGAWVHRGMHGGRGPFETKPVLIAIGDAFTAGAAQADETSITDIAPTVLLHLGLPTDGMDGRSLQPRVAAAVADA